MADYKPTTVFIAADHAGFSAKQFIIKALEGDFTIVDLGADSLDMADDYTPYAQKLAEQVATNARSVGLLVCGSGEGMAMAANKVKGIRAAVVWSEAVATETRQDNDANVATLPARYKTPDQLKKISHIFITTPFSGAERHRRRIDQITKLEDLS